jgi:hypothetical protein
MLLALAARADRFIAVTHTPKNEDEGATTITITNIDTNAKHQC